MSSVKSYFFVVWLALGCGTTTVHSEEPRTEQEVVPQQKKKAPLNPKGILRGFKILINIKNKQHPLS